jgi:glycosyltransferase involved in cell wall biosynthesis
VSIGLPERLEQLKNQCMRILYYQALRKVERIICYGFEETERLREWLNRDVEYVHFIPFGVDTEKFRPIKGRPVLIDVVSIGADSKRDFSLLIEFARCHPNTSARIITTAARAQELGEMPYNLELLTEVPFNAIPGHLASARVVALPLKQNSYSGATTTLLQAMAMAKPVVVSEVGAIKEGYNMQNEVNIKLVKPGDFDDFEHAIRTFLENPKSAQAIGAAARKTVVENLSWNRYVEALLCLFDEAIGLNH